MTGCYTFIATALGVALCLVAAALVALVLERDWQKGVSRCVAAASLDPLREAMRDYRNGERRFFFLYHNWEVGTTTADGIRSSVVSECNEKRVGGERPLPLRPLPFSAYAQHASRPDHYCCEGGPPRTACGDAIDRYIYAYNAEMARISPGSIKEYCR